MKRNILLGLLGLAVLNSGCSVDEDLNPVDVDSTETIVSTATTGATATGTGGWDTFDRTEVVTGTKSFLKPPCGADGTSCQLEADATATASGLCFMGKCSTHIPVTCRIVSADPMLTPLFVRGCDGADGIDAADFDPHGIIISSGSKILCSGLPEDVGFCDYGDPCTVEVLGRGINGTSAFLAGKCYLAYPKKN